MNTPLKKNCVHIITSLDTLGVVPHLDQFRNIFVCKPNRTTGAADVVKFAEAVFNISMTATVAWNSFLYELFKAILLNLVYGSTDCAEKNIANNKRGDANKDNFTGAKNTFYHRITAFIYFAIMALTRLHCLRCAGDLAFMQVLTAFRSSCVTGAVLRTR